MRQAQKLMQRLRFSTPPEQRESRTQLFSQQSNSRSELLHIIPFKYLLEKYPLSLTLTCNGLDQMKVIRDSKDGNRCSCQSKFQEHAQS